MLEEGDSVIGDHSEILGLSFEETVGDQGGGVDREWKRVVGKWSTWILNCEAEAVVPIRFVPRSSRVNQPIWVCVQRHAVGIYDNIDRSPRGEIGI